MRRFVVWLVDIICIPVGWAIDRLDFSDIGDDRTTFPEKVVGPIDSQKGVDVP